MFISNFTAYGGMTTSFVQRTCWTKGLYYYKELEKEWEHITYFGLPQDITTDGVLTLPIMTVSSNDSQNKG